MSALKSLVAPKVAAAAVPNPPWSWPALGLLLAYGAAGLLSLSAPQVGEQISLIWAPAGIALAMLIRFGPGLWPAVWVAASLLALSTGLGVGVSVLLGAGAAAGPAAGAWWMRRLGMHVELDRRRDLWLLGLVGAGASMAFTAGSCVVLMALDGGMPWRDVPAGWAYWWLGDAMGVAVVGVPLMTASRETLRRALAGRAGLATVLLAAAALGSAWWTFRAPAGSGMPSPLVFVPPLALVWLAARNGIFAASTVAMVISGMAVVGTGLGRGPFASATEIELSVALVSGYVCTLAAMPLLVTALIGEMAATDRHWRSTLDSSDIGAGEWDLRSNRLTLSARWLGLLGHGAHERVVDMEAFWRRAHPDDLDLARMALEALRTGAAPAHAEVECRMRRPDGGYTGFGFHAFVTETDAAHRPRRVTITARDVGDRLAAREQRHLSESLFTNLHEGLLITDAEHRVLEVNPTFTAITGYGRDELLGTTPPLLREVSARRADRAAAGPATPVGMSWQGEISVRRRDGDACLLQVTVSEVRGPDARVRNHVVAVTDLTQVRAQVDQLRLRAHFDELTRLPNRTLLTQQLQAATAAGPASGTLLTVCCLDLDHFKAVNDSHGPQVGDSLLVEVAERLRRSLRNWAGGTDVAARIGGDEFVMLLHTATLEEARHAVARLLRQVAQPVRLGDIRLDVTASIGATVYPFDTSDAETLLRHADHAMYGAKQAGRNGFLFFDAESDRRTEARYVALGRIQEALDGGELCLHYQPKVDLRNGRPLGMEALLRWNHPTEGVVAPAEFLPLIEHTGLGVTVGRWVLGQAVAQLDAWLDAGLDLTLNVNVSASHLQEPGFAAQLQALLANHDTPVARHLVLEVLETTALADIDRTRELMDACRSLGVRFALDDFGTGYSTFTYLKRLPLDMLKIDRSFVANMLHDAHDLAIVEGVVGLARTFGCSVVAEGIETAAQARRLAALGCEVGQGHGIALPMPAQAVAGWFRQPRAEPVPWPGSA